MKKRIAAYLAIGVGTASVLNSVMDEEMDGLMHPVPWVLVAVGWPVFMVWGSAERAWDRARALVRRR